MRNLVSVVACVLLLSAAASHAGTVKNIYAFGDSLNDCCNNPAAPFTNGPETWLVEFSALVGGTYTETTQFNYAQGGAQSGDFNAVAPGGAQQPNGLQSQIDQFQTDNPTIDNHDLAVIWVGTNDIWASSFDADFLFGNPALQIVKPLGSNPSVDELAGYIAGNIGSAVADLRDAGFGNALVVTPYDIGDSALVDVPGGPAQNTAYSEALRDKLLAQYTPGIDTFVLDTVDLIRALQAGSPTNGFTELTTNPSCSFGAIACNDRANPDSFIFLDFVHFTAATNSEIAKAAGAVINSGSPVPPVPLPAGIWFLLSASVGLIAFGRKRSYNLAA